MDNTLIIYITGDNGACANGGRNGRFNSLTSYNQIPETIADQLKHIDEFGGPHSDMTPPLGWAIADGTPFAYCQGTAANGGNMNGTVIHWPKEITAHGEIRPQYHHLIDIAPTVLEAASLPQPKVVNGTPQKPIEGVSMVYSFTNATAASPHTVQYTEFIGNRGIYKDGWYAMTTHTLPWERSFKVLPFDQDKWELYNMMEDFSCAIDLAAKYPDKVKELQAVFMQEAVKYNVLPLDDRSYERFNAAIAGRPDLMAGRTTLTVYPGMVGMKEDTFINVKNRSHIVTADVETPKTGANGVMLAQGGTHGGWSFYVKDNKPKFAYNYLGSVTTIASKERLPAGHVTISYDFVYDGGNPGSGGTGSISINGKQVATGRIEHTLPFLFGMETADVGMDLYTPVTSDYPKGKNAFTGTIDKITIELEKMKPADEAAAEKAADVSDEDEMDQD